MSDDTHISFDDFLKVEIRVGKILTCERVEKSRKLLRMDVDLGEETRQVVAGLAPYYLPAEMIGKRAAFVVNLKPAKLMGLESQAMVLAASPEQGHPVLLSVPEGTPPGARIS